MLHSALVHHQQENILLGHSNLKSEAAAFDSHGGRSAPAASARVPAKAKPRPYFAPTMKLSLFQTGNQDDAFGFVQQVLRHALVGRLHHVGQEVGGGFEALIGFLWRQRRQEQTQRLPASKAM